MKIDVTLVIPILNEAATLPTLLASIERQVHQPDQVVFVDGGSTDATSATLPARDA